MKFLDHKLAQWVHEGLITADQAQAIVHHEHSSPQHRNWAIFGIAGIGITAFITGVVSLVAANWDTISVTSKLITYFLIQLGFGAYFFGWREHAGIVREAAATLFALFFLAGIGLVAQIYNLSSNGYSAILFWNFLTLPITLLARNRLLSHLWIFGFHSALWIWYTTYVGRQAHQGVVALMVLVASFYFFYALGFFRFEHFRLPRTFRRAARAWSWIFIVCGLSIFSNILWASEFFQSWYTNSHNTSKYVIIPWFAYGLSVASLWIARPHYHTHFKRAQIFTLGIALLYFTIPFVFDIGRQQVLGCLFFMLVWAGAAASAGFTAQRRVFDFATFVIGLRFVGVYLEVFGTLTMTGLGLMFAGTLIIAVAYLWYKYRRRVEKWLGDRT